MGRLLGAVSVGGRPHTHREFWIQLPCDETHVSSHKENWGLRADEEGPGGGASAWSRGGQKRDGETNLPQSPAFGNEDGIQVSMAQGGPPGPSEYLEAGAHTARTCASTPSHRPMGSWGPGKRGLKGRRGRKGLQPAAEGTSSSLSR